MRRISWRARRLGQRVYINLRLVFILIAVCYHYYRMAKQDARAKRKIEAIRQLFANAHAISNK